jgi:secondary thiamine-phosphate synthase enzyme
LNTLSAIHTAPVDTIATARLSVETSGEGFFEITTDVARFLGQIGARDGAVLIYLKHTSASLTIQENADPDVRTDLVMALRRVAPADAGWVHEVEGPDDMPCQIHAQWRVVAGAGQWRRIGVGHMAGDLSRRAPHDAPSARSGSAVFRIVRQALRACH